MTTLGLVVPVFEEEERFAEFGPALLDFAEAQPAGSELVFVDDGSGDRTPQLVEDLLAARPAAPARLLRRPHEGKGGALSAGLRSVATDIAAFCDLDLSTPLEDLARIVAAAGQADVLAIGSRDLVTSTVTRHESRVREALGRSYNRLLQATVTPGITDTQCGAKAAARDVWDRVLPHCRQVGFAWDAEIVAVAQALGIVVREVPITWRHDDRSKVRVGRDGLRMVRETPSIWRSARAAASSTAAAAPSIAGRTGGAGAAPSIAAPSIAGRTGGAGAAPSIAASAGAASAGTTSAGTTPAPPADGVFEGQQAEELIGADRSHWWFRGKAALVATALRRTGGTRGMLVDVGAGAGGVTAMLGWDPDRLAVLEAGSRLVEHARHVNGVPAIRAAVAPLPLADGSVDVVCLLDVIEHLPDPAEALGEARRVLRPGGRLVVNVPAHRWLWSSADVHLGHHRRYERSMLRRELGAAGFEPMLLGHVFTWLVPFVWLERRLRGGDAPALGLDRSSFLIDRTALVLTTIERLLLGKVSVPLGTSVLCVARPTAQGRRHG